MKTTLLILITFSLLVWGLSFDTGRIVVQPGCAQVVSDDIKAAMKKIGDKRDFRVLEDGTLQVYLRGQWQRLRY